MKYGWEIAEDVQMFVSDTADIQFVPASLLDEANMEIKLLKEDNILMVETINKLKKGLGYDKPCFVCGLKDGDHDLEKHYGEI